MRTLVTAAAAALGLALAGCGGGATTAATGAAGGAQQGCAPLGDSRPVTVLITDVSGSTRDLRGPGGPFERDWLLAACHTALEQGTLWATTADSQTVANSEWTVRDRVFAPTIEDNDLLAAAELRRQADGLRPQARAIVGSTRRSTSDLVGALQVAARLLRDHPDRPRALVFLTDGGINDGRRDLGYDPPRTAEGRERVIARLRAAGRLPDLTGGGGTPVRVWMGGLGHGVGGGDPAKTQAVIDLWHALIPAAGGELVAEDSALRLPGFPG
jgi:hypothetical protein